MKIEQLLKEPLARRSIRKRQLAHPFDAASAETFALPSDAAPDQNNSYYFSCHGLDGTSLFFRLGLRGGGASSEVWFAYRDASGKGWVNAEQLTPPAVCPARVRCVKPEEVWEFSFHGTMLGSGSKEAEVSFQGTFTASSPIFEFSTHMDPGPLARALAREKWSRSFFAEVAQNHQTHYEQQGHVAGTLELGGRTIAISLPAMRDHSFGKRDWDYMDRHIWLMALLEDGRSLNVNMVRYPAVRELQTGYLISGPRTVCVHGATSMDSLPCTGSVPDSFDVQLRLADGRSLLLSCEKEASFTFPFDHGAYVIHEGVGRFTVDGVRGRGILEFGFNGDKDRWDHKIGGKKV
jgi:hypothetical protein